MAVNLKRSVPLHHLAPAERHPVYHNSEPNGTRERELLPAVTVHGDGMDLDLFIRYCVVHVRDHDGLQAPL